MTCDREDVNAFDEGYYTTRADNDRVNDDAGASALVQVDGATNVNGYEQHELYLVSSDGTYKTILRRFSNGIDDDEDGAVDEDGEDWWTPLNNGIDDDGDSVIDENDEVDGAERLAILELEALSDLDADNELDFTPEASNFQADGDSLIELVDFIPISPSQIDIVDLKFFISPLDDPRKAISESSRSSQIQPHVTIVLTTRPSKKLTRQLAGTNFDLSIQTTVSSRTLSNVIFPEP